MVVAHKSWLIFLATRMNVQWTLHMALSGPPGDEGSGIYGQWVGLEHNQEHESGHDWRVQILSWPCDLGALNQRSPHRKLTAFTQLYFQGSKGYFIFLYWTHTTKRLTLVKVPCSRYALVPNISPEYGVYQLQISKYSEYHSE